MTKEEIFAHFEKHEGVIAHMYLDTAAKVTVGIGFMMPDPAASLAYALVSRATGAAATSAEKMADWTEVSRQVKGRVASTYRRFTKLDLPDAEVRRVLEDKLRGFAESLRTRFPAYDTFPGPAQLALLDMIFNLGPRGLFNGFPKLCRAAERLQWATCAAECKRLGISADRNDDCKALFVAAVSAPARSRPALRRFR